jgi:uncharacterized phiE125 gp8 family phage protein
MSALQAVTLQEVKDELVIDFADFDTVLTGCLETAVELMESRTQHYLYERPLTTIIKGHGELFQYPVQIDTVTDATGAGVDYKALTYALYTKVKTCTDEPVTVNMTVGYATNEATPASLKKAVKLLAIHLYENRNVELTDIPLEIKMLYRPFVRDASI